MEGDWYCAKYLLVSREPRKPDADMQKQGTTEGIGGVLVSRSLTLSSAPEWEALFEDFLGPKTKKNMTV